MAKVIFSLGKLLRNHGINIESFEKLVTETFDKGCKEVTGLFHLKDGRVAKYTYSTSPNRLLQTVECDGGKKIQLITDKREFAAGTPLHPIAHTRAKVSVDGKPSEAYIHDKSLLRNGNIFQTLHGEKYYNLPDGRTQVNVLPRRAVCGNSELSRGEAYQEIYQAGQNPYITLMNKYPGFRVC